MQNGSLKLQVGCLDERGNIKGLSRRGFTPAKCLNELIANSLDALDKVPYNKDFKKSIIFDVFPDTVRMIDNGVGMNVDSASCMFAMSRENHASDKSRGVSGIGGKAALNLLGNRQEVIIYTCVKGGDHLRITVPWNRIHSEGVYTGMTEICPQTEEEKIRYNTEHPEGHGTTTVFRANETLKMVLEDSFIPTSTNLMDQPGIIFGRDDVEIIRKSHLCKTILDETRLRLYNYFSKDVKFYTEVETYKIEQYYSQKEERDRYVWRDGNEIWEVPSVGPNKFSTAMKLATAGFKGYHPVGEYLVTIGLREDVALFDPNNPRNPAVSAAEGGIGASSYICPYNKEYSVNDDDFLGSYKLVRNGQLIGLIPPPDVSISSARGTWQSNLETCIVQCDVAFNPLSVQETQDNHQDRAMNIQDNKNQFDGKSVPKNFTRLVKGLKKKKAQAVQAYIERILKSVAPPAVAEESAAVAEESPAVAEEPPAVAEESPAAAEEPPAVEEYENRVVESASSSDESDNGVKTPVNFQTTLEDSFGDFIGAEQPVLITGKFLKDKLGRLMNLLEDATIYNSPEYLQLSGILSTFTA